MEQDAKLLVNSKYGVRDIKLLVNALDYRVKDTVLKEDQEPHNGNARFVLDHVILRDAIHDREDLVEKVSKTIGYERDTK